MAISDVSGDVMRVVRRDAAAASEQTAALFALANGLVGVEGVIDECAGAPCAYLPDAYVSRAITYHERFPGYASATDTRVKCPSPVWLQLYLDGDAVDFGAAERVQLDMALDLASGRLVRTAHWRLDDGRMFKVVAERIVPLAGEPIVASRIALRPLNFGAQVEIRLVFGADHGRNAAVDADDPRISARVGSDWAVQPDDDVSVTRFRQDVLELAYRQNVVSGTAAVEAVPGGHVARQTLAAGDALSVDRIVALACGRGRAADVAPRAVVDVSFDTVAAQQAATVQRLWDDAGLTIDDDPELTQALRFGLFQLHQSASRDDNHSIAAKGLSGEGYEGHYFWDAETFMLPVLALQVPDRARTLIAYRASKLAEARAHAAALGHARGALYPWRTIAGAECSSHYPTGSAQYHINGDIAYALALYVAATDDQAFRRSCAEMLFETARIWLEIGAFDARRGGAFCIYGVTGPDEYSALVDNDYYTNAIARRHLAFAAATAAWLRDTAPDAYVSLAAAIGLDDDEIAIWRRAADAMWLPVDAATGVSPQDDAFLGRPRLPHDARGGGGPLLMRHHPMTLFRHQIAKQGNVVQAMAMDIVDLPPSLQRRNLDYYGPVTTHDSTLSGVSFGIVSARLGDEVEALDFLRECAFVDLEDRHANTSHGLHMAAIAGTWLVLAQGWGGLNLEGSAPSFRPRLPSVWSGYQFRLQWRGSVVEVVVGREGTTYRRLSGDPLTLIDHGRPFTLGADPVAMARPTRQGVIFDLDGVLTDTAEDHYHAWQELADRHGLTFDRAANDALKGVDRAASLRLILDASGRDVPAAAFIAMLSEKNDIYRARLASYSPADLFPGVRALFADLRRAGIKIGLASASRNAGDVVRLLGIADQFDFIADAAAVARAKPAPDIFLACAQGMGLTPDQCVGVEDAAAGIAAIHAAGMAAIGIGSGAALPDADFNVAETGNLSVDRILSVQRRTGANQSTKENKVEDISC